MTRFQTSASLACALLLCAAPSLCAQADTLKSLKDDPGPTSLAAALPLLADPAQRGNVRSTILGLDPFPAHDLVALLSDHALAVRLGALETLEEKAGGDFGFNPWAVPPAPENEAPLARWSKWLGEDKDSATPPSDLLGDEQRHGYLRDLLAADPDKSARARRMLEADGLAAVGFLENFLSESATLPAASRAKVREAQYQIVLSPAFGPQAPAMARELAFGSRDQMLAALSKLKTAGLSALPIIRDFLRHPDSLVRETAIDAILASGGPQSLPIVGPALAAETDPNVIHGALRRIKEIPGEESLAIATSFLSHEGEDLLVSAIQACQKLVAGDSDPFGNMGKPSRKANAPEEADVAVAKTLKDPRWRVRTAALEYIAAVKPPGVGKFCVELLRDPDEFVRFSAIKAVTALGLKEGIPVLREMFMENPSTVGPVLEGFAALGGTPDDEMIAKLSTYPSDARIAAIQASASDKRLAFLPLRLASDPDLDVSCAALRFLTSSSERIESPEVASILLSALRSGIPEKRSAVLDQIALPKSKSLLDPALSSMLGDFAKTPERTDLDPIYDSMLAAAAKASGQKQSGITVVPGAQGELLTEIAAVADSGTEISFRAALSLGMAGDRRGLRILLRDLPRYSTAQRAAIAGKLYDPKSKEALDLLTLLVRDPVGEIRADAVESSLSADESPAFLAMVLKALAEPGSQLGAHQLYSYRFESAARDQGSSGRALRNWAAAAIGNPETPDSTRILAIIGLGHILPPSSVETVNSLAKSSPNKWIRRAAWHCLASTSSPLFRDSLAELAADPSPFVREALPSAFSKMSSSWQHRFDDVNSQGSNSWSSGGQSRPLPKDVPALLEKLAAADPSPDVRFSSMCALLSNGREIDAEAFATLLRSRPKEERASYRVAEWMQQNLQRLGPGLAPIVSALSPADVNAKTMASILSKVSPEGKDGPGFTSFAALAAGATETAKAPQQTAPEESDTPQEVKRETILVAYFYKPGCAECEKAAILLEQMKKDFPLLKLQSHNIVETSGTLLNQALCARFGVRSADHGIAPAIFTQSGFLIRNDISPQAIGNLLSAVSSKPEDNSWAQVAAPEIATAKANVEQRYESLTLPVVLLAGLIDGLNPCAFATIIFFLSYLQIARRTRREMIMVGASFILAVFLSYFAAGLMLHKVLEKITGHISGIKPYLDWGFAALALIAAFLSFRDAAKARSGNLAEMSLTLPAFLKDRIRGAIRQGAKARRFVIAAFIVGVVISFLELACTGQVYAPIIYSIQQGKMDAVAWLFAYNLAFILPLIIIFCLTFAGMSSKALIGFQERHTFSVKIALGLVFLALAAVILFGSRLF